MSGLKKLAHDFIAALSSDDPARYEAVLNEEVGMRFNRWDGREIYRPRHRVIQRFKEEWSSWPDPSMESFDVLEQGDRIAFEYRIQATEGDRYVEHNRSVFLTVKDDKIQTIDLYCPEPMPSARRKGWIAPATLTDDEVRRSFASITNRADVREWISPRESSRFSLRGGLGGSGDPHPGSNFVSGMRWSEEEADRRIEEIIAYHRVRNIGFQWWVLPGDTPTDLGARLERHGMILAGDAAMMARVGLDNLDIPTNPDCTVEILDGSDEAALDAALAIAKVCFNWTDQQAAEQRPSMLERLRNPKFREEEATYLARLDGQPAAFGRVQLQGGIAYMGGAATLPELRGRKIYSTLLRRRLEEAHARGYHLAALGAEPLSRRIVAHYGFKEYSRIYVYGWMPVIDVDMIKSLVPQ